MKTQKKILLIILFVIICITTFCQNYSTSSNDPMTLHFWRSDGLLTITAPLILGGLLSFFYFKFFSRRDNVKEALVTDVSKRTQELILAQNYLIARNEEIKLQSDKILNRHEQILLQNQELKRSIEELKLLYSLSKMTDTQADQGFNLYATGETTEVRHIEESNSFKLENIPKNKGDREFIDKIIQLIDQDMANPNLDYKEICTHMAMSKSVLYIKFKAITGQGVQEFIKSIRLKKSLKLLEEGDMAISQIALEVGFNSQSYFNKCFFKQYGVGPKEFARKCRDQRLVLAN